LLKDAAAPKSFVYTVNAGAIPAEHWTHDPHQGGGRIVGEACHFIDLLRHICGHRIVAVQAVMLGGPAKLRDDKVTFTLQFADGSFGTVHYLANGNRALPKERLDIYCDGRVIQLENFRKLWTYGFGASRKFSLWRQDRGHVAEVEAFLQAIRHRTESPIAFDEAIETTCVSFDVVAAAKSGQTCRYATAAYSNDPDWEENHTPRRQQLAHSA
ncbi:MAG: Gfo/Idh/MocA family oxidoreductase, partial [Planctomycetaceae bacterium]